MFPVDNFVIKVNQLLNLNRNKYRRNMWSFFENFGLTGIYPSIILGI